MISALETRLSRNPATTLLGRGTYPVPEAAQYAGLHPARVRWWFQDRPGRSTRPLFGGDVGTIEGRLALSFLDLIDIRVAGQLRSFGVPMQVVRAAYDVLRTDLITPHPFAHSDLYTDGQKIFVRAANEVNEGVLSEVVSRQQFFPRVLELLTRIEYSERTHLAERWRVGDRIVIDPGIALGKPVVQGTGTTTFVLAEQYRANARNAALVADLFDVSVADVERAAAFEERLKGRRAA